MASKAGGPSIGMEEAMVGGSGVSAVVWLRSRG